MEVRNANNKRQQIRAKDNSDCDQGGRGKKVKLNILDHFNMVNKD